MNLFFVDFAHFLLRRHQLTTFMLGFPPSNSALAHSHFSCNCLCPFSLVIQFNERLNVLLCRCPIRAFLLFLLARGGLSLFACYWHCTRSSRLVIPIRFHRHNGIWSWSRLFWSRRPWLLNFHSRCRLSLVPWLLIHQVVAPFLSLVAWCTIKQDLVEVEELASIWLTFRSPTVIEDLRISSHIEFFFLLLH
jgi:hypothetical protein